MDQLVRILIVEDDVPIATYTKIKLEKVGFQVIGIADNVNQAISFLEGGVVDVILIDIQVKGTKDGIFLAKEVRQKYQSAIIFISSHTEARIIEKAKQVKPNAFLSKPFKEEDLLIAIELAINTQIQAPDFPEKLATDSLFVRDKGAYQKIKFNQIHWLKASGTYTEIHTVIGKKVVKSLLKNLEEKLPEDFIRVHKSYIVNIKEISAINASHVFVNEDTIPISRDLYSELLERFNTI